MKQIKVGHDKVPSPITEQFPQLVDIEGNLLFDDAGNPLLTREQGTLTTFSTSENSTSAHINNDSRDPAQIVPVTEIFPEQSAVSTNLLGYERAETQVSLFSDVSTYGFDEVDWNYYTFTAGLNYPEEWYNKEHPIHGRRTRPVFEEQTSEQALFLKSFPSQYTYPFGPAWNRPGQTRRYRKPLFTAYLSFIAMGKYLYNYFLPIDPVFAKRNFISERINIVENLDTDPNGFLQGIPFSPGSSDLFTMESLVGSGPVDVNYGDDLQLAFDEVERWTYFWGLIGDNLATFPQIPSNISTVPLYQDTDDYREIKGFIDTPGATRPGYSSDRENFAVMESKNTFRYQPGRASGFTFGTRMRTDSSSLNNYIEWGAINDTDQYVFQLRGSQFNIIRRSVIPLPTELIERMGLSEDAVNDNYYPVGLETSQQMQEVVVSRDNWNGDKLDGAGPSGYTLQFENVTMYKIEFSWYGAIGAKFYAYVPVENDEARWVLMHTLVIENGMGQPILKNPDFKFRYLVYSNRTSGVTEPFFIYKYGSSYYIDGGDEGTIRLSTVTADSKPFLKRTPVIGVFPKTNIESSYQATDVNNLKKLYPSTVSVNSDQPVRIDIEEIQGSSDGFHHHYSPSLVKGRTGNTHNVVFNSLGTELTYANTNPITGLERSKVIADGIYNVYLSETYSNNSPLIARRSIDNIFDYTLSDREISERTELVDGTEFLPRSNTAFDARFSVYDFAAARNQINSENFKIHFLNPTPRDGEYGNRHFSDFLIGIMDKEPNLNLNGDLVFGTGGDEEEFVSNTSPLSSRLFVEWTCLEERTNERSLEDSEWDVSYGTRFENDPRITRGQAPLGLNTGDVSSVSGEVITYDLNVDSIVDMENGTWKILFPVSESVPINVIESSINTGEIGINGVSTGIVITGNGVEGDPEQIFILLDGNPGSPSQIQLRSVSLKSDWKLLSFDSDGEPRFENKRWVYTKAFAFNILPLYFVVGMRDGARINNIVIEEERSGFTYTSTPQWLVSNNSPIGVETVTGVNLQGSPSNFDAETRLQGSLFDTQTDQPLRNGTVLNSFFVEANKPEQIDLSNIFDFDRRNLSTGLYNNKAIFFTASRVGNNGGNIEMTLTVREQ